MSDEARSPWESEDAMMAAFAADARAELALADAATDLLVRVLVRVDKRTAHVALSDDGRPEGGDVETLRLAALAGVGVRALRVIRAARAVLGAGYEPEARAHDRILFELLAHRRAILDDATGLEALRWLQGKRRDGISKRVKAMTPEGLWRQLCHDSHGDPVPVARLFDHEADAIQLAPRRTTATRASLLMYSGFARDQAVAVAALADVKISGIDDLDAAIGAAWAALIAEDEGAAFSSSPT
jgi:hypothetical protein